MGKRQNVIDHLFAGQQDPLGNIMVQLQDATSPNTVITAPQGTFLLVDYTGDDSDKDIYINTDGASAWTQVHNDV